MKLPRSLWSLVVLAIAAPAATAYESQPDPKVMVTTSDPRAPGPNYWVKIAAQLPGAPDSVFYTVRQGATTILASRWRPTTVVRDSFSLVKPAPGASTTGNGCAMTRRRGLNSNNICKPYTFTTPDVPPPDPVVDVTTDTLLVALRILPRPVTMTVGGTAQPICLIAKLPSGRAGYRGARTALCDAQALAVGQPPTATGQAKIDATCFSTLVEPVAGATGNPPLVTLTAPCSGTGLLQAPVTVGLGLLGRAQLGRAL